MKLLDLCLLGKILLYFFYFSPITFLLWVRLNIYSYFKIFSISFFINGLLIPSDHFLLIFSYLFVRTLYILRKLVFLLEKDFLVPRLYFPCLIFPILFVFFPPNIQNIFEYLIMLRKGGKKKQPIFSTRILRLSIICQDYINQ